MDILKASACDLGRAITEGLAPTRILETFLDAIRAHPFRETIYVQLLEERARHEAKAASERAAKQKRHSLLDGVPISWKDLFDTEGLETSAGSRLLEGRIPKKDCQVLSHASRAGLVALGKTHMTELAFSGLGINPVTATPPNVRGAHLAPGGSSSGAAASVTFGLASAAIGSDTGGSGRIPAAWNNLVGFKPTHGRLSLDGVVPLCPNFDTVAPMARTVEDVSALSQLLNGQEIQPIPEAEASQFRLGLCKTVAFDDLDPDVEKEFERVLHALSGRDVQIKAFDLPEISHALGLSGILFTTEAYGIWRDAIEAAPDKMYSEIRERFRSGAQYLGADYVAAQRALLDYRARFAEATSEFDAIILPTSPIMPPNRDQLRDDSAYYKKSNLLALRNTRIGNLMGLCAISLPIQESGVGFMLMGAPKSDEKLLSIAQALSPLVKA